MVKTGKAEINPSENCTIQNKMKPYLRLSSSSVLSLALIGGFTCIASKASAQVLVQDSLTTLTSTSISGRTPDQETNTGATYIQGTYSNYRTTATGAVDLGSDGLASVVLPVAALTSGHVYTLTIQEALGAVDTGPNGSDLAQFGFDNTAADSSLAFYSSTGPSVAVLANGSTRNYAGQDNIFAFGGGTSPTNGVTTGIVGPNTLKLVLDTTGSAWTVTNYVNGVESGSFTYSGYADFNAFLPDGSRNYDYGTASATEDSLHNTPLTNPTIDSISFSDGGGAPHFTNLQFSESSPGAVPEPATWAYLVSGLALLGVCLRRKRCQV